MNCLKKSIYILFSIFLISENIGCIKEPKSYMYNMYFALINYANDHGGWLPKSETTTYDALSKLYPNYCSSGRELAGVSGNEDLVIRTLKSGKPLTDKLTSWIYEQGYKEDDDPNLAVIWESKSGLYFDGRVDPSGGHAVLLLSGHVVQIAGQSWTSFLTQQKQLREAILAKRIQK